MQHLLLVSRKAGINLLKNSKMKMSGSDESWEDFSGRLRNRFSKLTEDDVVYKEGYEEKMIAKIAVRLNRTPAEVIALFERMKITRER